MKIAIIDDEMNACEILAHLIGKIPNVKLVGVANGVAQGVNLIEDKKPDIVLLDIKMNDGSGFDVLDRVKNNSFKVIFVTAFDNFAIRAFKYSASDYLLKPITLSDLKSSLARVYNNGLNGANGILRDAYQLNDFGKINLPGLNQHQIASIDEILYCKSENNYTWFYFKDGTKVLCSKTLKFYQDLLPINIFLRCHQSYLVNIKYTVSFEKKSNVLLLKDSIVVPVSIRKKPEVLLAIRSLGII